MANSNDRSIGQEQTKYFAGPAFSEELPGTRIGGHYEIDALIGRGGMGAVYRCRDLRLGRAVALKRILTSGPGGDAGLERFRREAHAVASLNHRNIVIVHEFAEDANGPYLVMELLGGSDLGAFVAAHGAMPVAEVIDTAKQVGSALSYAHRRGIVHRDIKPTNLFRLKDRTIKVLDFGLARVGTDSQLSQEGFGLGTLDYVSPEQRRDATRVDHRSDLFSLGATLYYLATGKAPRLVRERDLPDELRSIVLLLMEDQPEDRPFSVDEALAPLQAFGPSARPPSSGALQRALDESPCAGCGARNSADSRFCMECGLALFAACPACKTEARAGRRFCANCGAAMPDVSKGPAGTRAPFTTDTTAASDRGELSPGDAGLARVPPAAFEPAAVGAGAGRSVAHASVQAQSALDDTVRTADVLVGRDGGATIVPPLSPQGVLDASAASIEPMTTVIDERILLSRVQARLARFAGLLAFALALQNATAWAQFDQFREVFGWQSNLTGNGEIAFSLACCVLSIPSVWLMRRVGVRRWIATSLLLSALIWASPMNVSVAAMIPIPRLLAGIVQAGFFPGLVLYLASWFPRRARVAPIAWLLAGGVIATFIPGPLTRMLIAIEPSDELNVWRILLLIEAIPAFLLGLIALRYLTDAPKDARWLSDPEQKALQTLLDDDEGIDAAARPQAIGRVLTSWRVWALAGVALVLMLGLQSATVAHDGFFGRSWSHAGPSFGALAALWIVAMLSRRGDSRRHGAVFAVIAAVGAFMFFAWGPTTLSMTIALTLALGGIWGALAPFWATASAVASPAAGKVAVPLIYAVSSLSFVLMIAVFQELGARAITILVGICLLSGAAVFVKAAPRISEHSPIAN